ncbi:MAG: hypothetical protein Ct9H300mP1_32660 [Planctomycetaceae bacterium]|nr:MAG: hypothetical protein Ct9H300mP1_32660 [Planctomycetaceae bacterium]
MPSGTWRPGLGDALGRNPDLHIDMALDFLPKSSRTSSTRSSGCPASPGFLTHKTKLPEVQVKKGQLPPIDPYAAHRTRALQLFLDQLKATSDPRTRGVAVTMAQATSLRRNPEVLNALEAMLKFEKRKDVVKTARNVLSTNRKNFLKELTAAGNREKPRKQPATKTANRNSMPSSSPISSSFVTTSHPKWTRCSGVTSGVASRATACRDGSPR